MLLWALQVYAAGAMAMALFGPSPWWIRDEYRFDGNPGKRIGFWAGVGIWLAWVAGWPVVVIALLRAYIRRLYDH